MTGRIAHPPDNPRTTARHRRGLSLFELGMTLAIMGVIAAIAMPRYAGAISRYRVDLAARRIAADLAMAQNRARVTGSTRTVTFTPKTATYVLASVADFKTVGSDYTVKLSESPYQAAINSVDLGSDGVIVFNGYGYPDSGGSIVVSSGSNQKTVAVNATTGGVTIQ